MAARPEISAPYDMRAQLPAHSTSSRALDDPDPARSGRRRAQKFQDFQQSLAGISPNTLSAG